MKKINLYITPFILLIFAITACDVIEKPYLEPIGVQPPTPDVKVKKVLLEEYTGHKCPNCPEATEEANILKGIYGEQLVLLATHAGPLAEPDATGLYTADFTTETGNTLFSKYDPGYVPSGTVNRSTNKAELVGEWQGHIDEILAEPQVVNIVLETTFDDQSFGLDVKVDVEFMVDTTGTYNLCFYILESGIIAPQLNDTGNIPNYQHNHMLRDSYGGAWGLEIASGNIISGEIYTEKIQITIESGMVPENTSVIAFVTDALEYRILQAEEKHIIE